MLLLFTLVWMAADSKKKHIFQENVLKKKLDWKHARRSSSLQLPRYAKCFCSGATNSLFHIFSRDGRDRITPAALLLLHCGGGKKSEQSSDSTCCWFRLIPAKAFTAPALLGCRKNPWFLWREYWKCKLERSGWTTAKGWWDRRAGNEAAAERQMFSHLKNFHLRNYRETFFPLQ